MQELAGRLAALDPDAGDELRVIGYFDALIRGCAGTEALVKGAAVLSGAVAGAAWPGGALRISPDGQRLPPEGGAGWPGCDADDARVWIERHGTAHANDAMVLERCALGLAVVRTRHRTRTIGPIAVLIDADREEPERSAAARRAGIGPRVRVAATGPEQTLPVPSAVVPGPDGALRVGLLTPSAGPLTGSVGLGRWGPATSLPDSWTDAAHAARLALARGVPVDTEELGGLLDAAVVLAARRPAHPDVVALEGLDPRALEVLDALATSDSLRAAATSLGMHHSSLSARRDRLEVALGFDPASSVGRARTRVARMAQHLRDG